MQNETPFDIWWPALQAKIAERGLPELDEDLATLSHMEGLSVEQALEEYAAGFKNNP